MPLNKQINCSQFPNPGFLQSDSSQGELLKVMWETTPLGAILMVPGNAETPVLIGDCNQVTCETHGYKREELIGQSIDLIHVTPWAAIVELEWFDKMQGAAPSHGQTIHKRKDGSTFAIEFTVTHVKINGQNCALGFDTIIENYDSKDELTFLTNNHWLNAMESSDVGIWDFDVGERQIWVSPRVLTILGQVPVAQKLPLDRILEKLHPEDRRTFETKFEEAVAQKKKRLDIDFRYKSPNGLYIWLQMRGKPIFNTEGNAIRILGNISDISEQKLAEERVERARKEAEMADQAKSQFLAVMSHEIRTPMNGVLGMATLLGATDLNDEQQSFLDTIESSGESLLKIIDDILHFSKIEAGSIELENRKFDVVECMRNALSTLSTIAVSKGLKLLLHVDSSAPQFIHGDESRIRQIVLNLLGNAIKFTESGEVEISLKAKPANSDSADSLNTAFYFSIRDTGIGIDTKGIRRLFKPFSQVDASTTRKYGGTGLGLAICKKLLTQMGGGIEVKSTIGMGSSFNCWIQTNSALDRAIQRNEKLLKRSIVVLEHNTRANEILASNLRALGAHPIQIKTTHELRDMLASKQKIDCAIVNTDAPSNLLSNENKDLRSNIFEYQIPVLRLEAVGAEPKYLDDSRLKAQIKMPASPEQIESKILRAIFDKSTELDIEKNRSTYTEKAEPQTENILIVEDNQVNRIVADQLVAKLGFKADTVSDGYQALAQFPEKDYDIIFMDIQMPGMNGFETLEKLRTIQTDTQKFPWVIALTADAMSGDRELCLASGMDDYIPKPIRLATLKSAIESARAGLAIRRP